MTFHTTEQIYEIFLSHRNICTDTRKIEKGCLFLALKGQNFNGNSFALQAIEQGAAFAIIDELPESPHPQLILVDNVLTTLQQLARHHRLQSQAKILAITGTNGKTTTKELIAHVLQTTFNIIYTQGNLNNHIGVPLTLLTIKEETEIAIIEMGANHVGEIKDYCQWALPDLGLITNIGKAHLEGFGGLEGVKKAKGELYDFLSENHRPIFKYNDDINLNAIGQNLNNVTTYGFHDADITADNLMTSQYATVDVIQPEGIKGRYSSQLIGGYNAPNILCAVTLGHYFNIPANKIQQAIIDYTPQNARSQFMRMDTNAFIIDAYNANPTSMKAAIENFKHQDYQHKIICLGGMKELGDESLLEHQLVIQLLKDLDFSEVYLVGQEFQDIHDNFNFFTDSLALKKHFLNHPIHNATILIKGSRGSKMEIVLEAFK